MEAIVGPVYLHSFCALQTAPTKETEDGQALIYCMKPYMHLSCRAMKYFADMRLANRRSGRNEDPTAVAKPYHEL